MINWSISWPDASNFPSRVRAEKPAGEPMGGEGHMTTAGRRYRFLGKQQIELKGHSAVPRVLP